MKRVHAFFAGNERQLAIGLYGNTDLTLRWDIENEIFMCIAKRTYGSKGLIEIMLTKENNK